MLDQFRLNARLNGWLLSACVLLLAACGSNGEEGGAAFRATLPPQQEANAPVYTATPTLTATATPTLTVTPSLTPTLTLTATPSPTPTPTLTVTPTVSPTPTIPLHTLTPASFAGAPPVYNHRPAEFTTPEGWSCGDFPCADDIDGFLQRIQVPRGYSVSHAGRFPGQPMQIAYGPDHRLYATVLLDGTREGAVFALGMDDENGQATQAAVQIGPRMISPVGLAFQPGTDVLYVSARLTPESGGVLYRLLMDGTLETVRDDLPCCLDIIDNQPAGMVFGPDGYLYLGVGSLTDHAESTQPESQPFAIVLDDEAAVLRIQPHTGETSVYARGIRYPYDLTFDSSGQMFATDSGVLEGPGDRVLAVDEGAHYGWPWYRTRGCADCPARDFSVDLQPDLLALPPYTLPRGIVAYTGQQFPVNVFDSLFIALWHGTPNAQRVIRVEPASVANNPEALDPYGFIPEPFVTGLIRPVDLTIAPDGSLIVADFIYGHIWRIRYTRGESDPAISTPVPGIDTPVPGAGTPVPGIDTPVPNNSAFATVTPTPQS